MSNDQRGKRSLQGIGWHDGQQQGAWDEQSVIGYTLCMDLTTPAVLFPAISLLLLAYTNRFLALSALVRSLHEKYQTSRDPLIAAQIGNLRYRVALIRSMQALGVLSLLVCVSCMMLLFAQQLILAKFAFGASLVLMALSLAFSFWEIQISVNALNLQLRDLEEQEQRK
jgi:hypothetical protein